MTNLQYFLMALLAAGMPEQDDIKIYKDSGNSKIIQSDTADQIMRLLSEAWQAEITVAIIPSTAAINPIREWNELSQAQRKNRGAGDRIHVEISQDKKNELEQLLYALLLEISVIEKATESEILYFNPPITISRRADGSVGVYGKRKMGFEYVYPAATTVKGRQND